MASRADTFPEFSRKLQQMGGRIVICGGSGFIGSALKSRLTDAGYVVRVVSRHPKIDEISWDQLATELEEAEAVINLSGRSIACKFTDKHKQEILSSRINSTKLVAEAIEQCTVRPRKWINASATGFYGDRGDEILTETSRSGSNFSAKVCIAWEDACLHSPAKTEKVVIRIGVVLSAHGGVLKKLIPLVKVGLGGAAGSGHQWLS